MKKFTLVLLLIGFLGVSFAQVNGSIQMIGDKKIVHLWGNHYQRGFAHGYLLAEECMQIYYNYFYQTVTYSNNAAYNNLMNFMQARFCTEQKYLDEVQGILEGVQAAGVSTFNPGLGRELTAQDILLANAIVDLNSVRTELLGEDNLSLGCASLSSWGASTATDSLLAGNIVITRLMDWDRNSHLLNNPVMLVHHPSEATEQKWISLTYPGFIGALSAISEGGSAAFLNVGNVSSFQYSIGLRHILFSVRDGIEMIDYDGDGEHRGEDIYNSINDHRHLSGTIVHTIWESDSDRFTDIVENNWWGTALRKLSDNGNFPGTNLAATNHFRLLYNPICCGRYEAIYDSLLVDPVVPAKRQWTLLAGAAGWENNLMAMQYTPSLGTILWANANSTSPAYQLPAINLNTADLFILPVANEEYVQAPVHTGLVLYPHPHTRGRSLNLKAGLPIDHVRVYNLKGQLIQSIPNTTKGSLMHLQDELQTLKSGLYIIRVQHSDGRNSSSKLLVY
ncbi:MAG: T9SS type A sorting domain-containing protein [Candidatus Cloacimonadaceae bacterium]|nr:T9SS type A sorting domain-containing protein [Candidatus Cloacimonadaceae bacterium]